MAAKKVFSIKAKLWKWGGTASWFFVDTPTKETVMLREIPRAKKNGFGSIKVRCTIGKTTWDTSLFPSKDGPYLLPIKASVRRAEEIAEGDIVNITCTLI
jgi:Domain of unknown function (DUF1905)